MRRRRSLAPPARLGIRAARRGDYGALAKLFRRFYREEGFSRAALARVPRTLAEVLRRRDTAAFLAEAQGRIVGAIALSSAYGLEVGAYAEIEDLYVLPGWRRHGVASALVAAGLDWARRRGCHDVEVVLTPHAQGQRALLQWYRRRGFADTGRRIFERALKR
jgi:GNAT superfamily N-acetyltransferase